MPAGLAVCKADRSAMRRALSLAARGAGFTSPNPQVGALIVKDGVVLAEGWHHGVGLAHAEVDALAKLDFKAPGATLYVTLEPCNHQGRTPPCTEAILRSGIRRVVIAANDPNPQVKGGGAERLRAAGLEVVEDVLAAEAQRQNAAFLTAVTQARPYVVAKAAVTLDGQLATKSGDSGQGRGGLSGSAAFRYVHKLRHELDAILVGAGTVRADDPLLSCRLKGPVRQPLRLVLDGRGQSPLSARLFRDPSAPTCVLTSVEAPAAWRKSLLGLGVELLVLPGRNGRLAPKAVLEALFARGVQSVLLEGGSQVLAAFYEAGLIDRFDLIYTPRLMGGPGLPLLNGEAAATREKMGRLRLSAGRRLGDDWLISAEPLYEGP